METVALLCGIMKPLEPPDTHFLSAAQGWFMLGNPTEALSELARISPAGDDCPEVLEIRWQIEAALKHWHNCLELANRILEANPDQPAGWIHRSFSMHELRRTSEAKDYLLPAAQKFPKDSTITYNLACYCCQLGQLDEARHWLARAVAASNLDRIRTMALADPDLQPMRQEIENW